MIILGLDIGGANTKAALIYFKDKEIIECFSYIEYFPFWEKNLNDFPQMLKRIVENVVEKNNDKLDNVDYISITMTAELSDAFQTKKEGILAILKALKQVFDTNKMFFINNDRNFIDFESVKSNYLSIAASNWVSTSLFLGNFQSQCILIDGGSTTIDIIPIFNSIPVSQGKDDISRMLNHELVYTGGLRATIPSITHLVPYQDKLVRISFEKFALISDIHLILGNITEDKYLNDTADNRSKSLEDCYARLSRIICMDKEMIMKDDLNKIAEYIYEKQLEILSDEIQQFMAALIVRYPEFENNPKFIITGLSADFLIRKTLLELGYNNILSYEEITNIPDQISSSAFAVAGAFYYQLKGFIKYGNPNSNI
ncbi:MAG: hydantoinase/oxoprolinase family protein [Promethearchaeota archaeon]